MQDIEMETKATSLKQVDFLNVGCQPIAERHHQFVDTSNHGIRTPEWVDIVGPGPGMIAE